MFKVTPKPEQAINASIMPANVAAMLINRGIHTLGALMDTDAYKALVSGRYDPERVREINGIPVSAFNWMIS